MHKTNICYGPNNYVDILYFLSHSNIHPHIDLIKFSCNNTVDKPEETLFSVLEDNNYKCEYDNWSQQGSAYDRIRKYYSCETGIIVSILYNRISRCLMYPCMGINIYKPDIDTVHWFDAICNSLGFITTLSHVELTIDVSPYECGLHEFFWKHLFLKYHSGDVCFVGGEFGSFYIGHKAKNSKSIILYYKKVNGLNVLRLEFRFKRSFLKRLELELCCLEKINNIDLSRLISFKQLNHEKLSKHLQWRHKTQILRLGDDYSGIYIDQLMDCTGFEASVANEIACMKKSRYKNNCQRFLEDLPEANNALFERLRNVEVI